VAVPMSVLKSTALIALAALVSTASVTLAQKAPAAHSRAELAIYASVLNDRGSPVTSLGPADFVVREEGVEREVTQVSPASEPVRIAVLADTSQSMEPYINDLRGTLRSFFKEINGNADIALFEFGDRPARLVDYTRDPTLLEAGIGRLFARRGGGAYALDAIVEASRDSRVRESARPVIVVISGPGAGLQSALSPGRPEGAPCLARHASLDCGDEAQPPDSPRRRERTGIDVFRRHQIDWRPP
jgi:von Willebrand factor type A domain